MAAPNRRKKSELKLAIGALNPMLVKAVAFSLLAGVAAWIPLGFIREVHDRVVTSRNTDTLLMLVLLVLLAYVMAEACEWAASRTLADAAGRLDSQLSVRALGLVYTDRLRRPAAAPQALTDLHSFGRFLASPQAAALMQLPIALLFLGLLAWMSPVLTVAAAAALALQALFTYLNERATQDRLQEANALSSSAQRLAEESLRTAEIVEALGMASGVRARWAQDRMAALALQQQASEAGGRYQTASRWVANNTMVLMMALGAYLVIRNEDDLNRAGILVAAMLAMRAMSPLMALFAGWNNVVNARLAYQRLDQALTDNPPKDRTMPLPPPTGHLKVETLVASAPSGGPPILRGVAFELEPGQLLVVMGASGAGKTTLARLLVGLWPALQGKVRLDGVDVHTWSKAELGPHIGYLGQTVDLMEGTVAENIARFGPASPDLVESAARLVGMHDTIMGMPQGYATPVGPGGAFLSGGQRQRVALARAIYGSPRLLVLDEPNSSLDEAGDRQLLDTLQTLKQDGATVVVISHRPGVLQVADRMLVLRDGVQQAFGTPQQVMGSIRQALAQQQPATPASAARPAAA